MKSNPKPDRFPKDSRKAGRKQSTIRGSKQNRRGDGRTTGGSKPTGSPPPKK